MNWKSAEKCKCIMEIANCESTSIKKLKLNVDGRSMEMNEPVVEEKPALNTNFKSPITDPSLTPEIWEQIFRDLSADDFLSVINAAPEWNHLLDSRKTTELFPMMLSHVLPYLRRPDWILACRRVQRGSKEAVDKFLQTHALYDRVFSRRYSGRTTKERVELISNHYDFTHYRRSIDDLSEALALQTKAVSYNPFLTRTLSGSLRHLDDFVEAEREVDQINLQEEANHVSMTELLSRFGTHLWVFVFTFYGRVDSSGVAKLCNYLSHLPNLKTLRLCQETETVLQIGDGELPPMEYLRYLDFSGFYVHSVTSRLIQRYAAQITTLEVTGSWIKLSNIEASTFNGLFPKLKRLRVRDVDAAVLEKLSPVGWPLEALNLRIVSCLGYKRELLRATISNLKPSLRQLELNLVNYFDASGETRVFDQPLSVQEDEEAMVIARSAFKQSTKMEKLVAWWAVGYNIRKVKIVKIQSVNSDEEPYYKLICASCPWNATF